MFLQKPTQDRAAWQQELIQIHGAHTAVSSFGRERSQMTAAHCVVQMIPQMLNAMPAGVTTVKFLPKSAYSKMKTKDCSAVETGAISMDILTEVIVAGCVELEGL